MSVQFLNEPDDVRWLRDTALKGVTLPAKYVTFESFMLMGNEDAPDEVHLYVLQDPSHWHDYLRVKFINDPPIYCEYIEMDGQTLQFKWAKIARQP